MCLYICVCEYMSIILWLQIRWHPSKTNLDMFVTHKKKGQNVNWMCSFIHIPVETVVNTVWHSIEPAAGWRNLGDSPVDLGLPGTESQKHTDFLQNLKNEFHWPCEALLIVWWLLFYLLLIQRGEVGGVLWYLCDSLILSVCRRRVFTFIHL